MPRWLRQFTFNQIDNFYRKESEEYEKASRGGGNKSTLMDPSGNVNKEAWKGVQKPFVQAGSSKVKYQ